MLFYLHAPPVICHVVGITYQTIEHRLLAEMLGDPLGRHLVYCCACLNYLSVRQLRYDSTHISGLKNLVKFNHVAVHPRNCADTQVKVWMNKYSWTENDEGQIFIFNQEESVKPKNIVEKIDFESESKRTQSRVILNTISGMFLYQRKYFKSRKMIKCSEK